MNARMVRLKKEARALFWPWSAVVIVGASPLVVPHAYAEPLSFLSFFFGIPLLATLSLGNELYHRTFSLWLTQPVSRMQLWGEKMTVMLAAVLSAGLVSGVVMFTVTWPPMRLTYKVAAVVYVLVSAVSGTFFTLATRSTLGCLLLISFMLSVGSLFSGGIEDSPHKGISSKAAIGILSTLGLCFSALMLWLGVRKLARFQVSGATSGEDLLVSGPTIMPESFAAWFRCRPRGALLNLIRKEFRLLRPLWLIGFLIVLYVACLAVFRLLPAPPEVEPRSVLEWVLLGPLVSLCIAMAGLAGILSLGEERTSGTQAWHMTLPISACRQWFIKLATAMFAGLTCSLVFPVLAMMAGGAVYGSPLMYLNVGSLPDLFVLFAILTFTCFWCACAANATLRAVVWAVPVTAAVALASSAGITLGQEVARTGTLRDLVVSSFHLNPSAFANITEFARQHLLWLFVPTLLIALLQSYWLFRAPSQSSPGWMLRCVLPLTAVTILWSFSACAGFLSSRWEPFEETRRALDRFQPTAATLEITGVELAKGGPLSSLTRRWLTGSRIALAPDNSRPSVYRATIHLASGLECRLIVVRSGGLAASCGKV
jgi:hypothetical protein